ncbi:ThuA domain-containing protein [Flexithrix dorotheae]|uniref:ThuA domain-containing protein n=1 Tax=Flexithrix dorotheae TaxID=70993 RepID=UPI00036083CD|nr:ThuA domain-containing protein [Flexithrix dorotheae]
MKKLFRIVIFTFFSLISIALIFVGGFMYKARYGFNFYDSNPPEIPESLSSNAILVFSKTNGFRHEEAIKASIPAFQEMAGTHNWNLYFTDNGAVFNEAQLARFKVVVWNNVSGKVLDEVQRKNFRGYLENGGGFVGIHASGDNSHQWDWYENELIGAHFSHHPLKNQFQKLPINLEIDSNFSELSDGLLAMEKRSDEWYIFFDNPREAGKRVLYTLDETDFRSGWDFLFFS